MRESARPELAHEIEQVNREKYEQEYDVASASLAVPTDCNEYFYQLTRARLDLIARHGHRKAVLDICCGTGDYLFESRHFIERGVGIDFSPKMIFAANAKKARINAPHIEFALCNARQIPIEEQSFDLAYSFSSLYHIPWQREVVLEAARILKPNSVAILEFGNLHSINTVVCRAYPELAIPCHITIREMNQAIEDAGLQVLEKKRFQILPLWGDKPRWLRPLLHPFWKRALQSGMRKRTLDELLCSLPVLGGYCFRQVFICRKA